MAAIEQNGASGLAPAPRRTLGSSLRWPLMILAPLIIVVAAVFFYLGGGRYQETDDAYLNASRVNISASIPGRVVEMLVHENQLVKRGDVLFRIDNRDYEVAIANARAQLAQARLNVRATQSTYDPANADLSAAKADLDYREKELARQKQLTASGVGSQRDLDQRANDVVAARDKVKLAEAQVKQALATIGGSPTGATDEHPAVMAAQAALDRAILNLSYTIVLAPQDGRVTKVEQLQVGSYINASQPLFSLIAPRMWIDANFKEDQLNHMRVGQHGVAELDAFKGEDFPVHIESLSPGTGAAFAVLPAENATGNWVKVTQRLPIRIAFDHPEQVADKLHAGLSAKVKIDTLYKRNLFGPGTTMAAAPRP